MNWWRGQYSTLETGPLARVCIALVLAVARLVGQVEEMVRTPGDSNGVDAAQLLSSWLHEPQPALFGEHPASYMDTIEGRTLISGLVAQNALGRARVEVRVRWTAATRQVWRQRRAQDSVSR